MNTENVVNALMLLGMAIGLVMVLHYRRKLRKLVAQEETRKLRATPALAQEEIATLPKIQYTNPFYRRPLH